MPQAKPDAKKAKEAYERGVRAERNEDLDAAYTAYSDAVNYAPKNRDYFIHRELAKSRLVQERADAAERDAVSGRLDDARKELLSRNLPRSDEPRAAGKAGGADRAGAEPISRR